MTHLQVGNTDIILNNYEPFRGKIIISHSNSFNFSHYWDSMGKPIEDFIKTIDKSYFVGKLCPHDRIYVFDGKRTATSLRKAIAEFLAWYDFMDFQKEMRAKIKELESIKTQDSYFSWISTFSDFIEFNLDLYDVPKDYKEEFDGVIEYAHIYIQTKNSKEADFLERIFPKIKRQLNK